MQGGGFDFPPMPAPAGHGGLSGLAAQPPRPGTTSSGPGAAGDSLDGHAVYVSYDEKREVAERKLGRKSGGHTYTVKFYLCDTRGTEYLAATGGQGPCLPSGGLQHVNASLAGARWKQGSLLRSCCVGGEPDLGVVPARIAVCAPPRLACGCAGEDQGDAHYLYENTSGFPFLRANNKAVSPPVFFLLCMAGHST